MAVPMAVELGSLEIGVADSSRASVVTSRMRTVLTPKTALRAGTPSAMAAEMPGASEVPIHVTPSTMATRNRYCGIVGA